MEKIKLFLSTLLALSFLVLIGFGTSACDDEGGGGGTPTIDGCTDIAALNYNSSANSDDGSCNYDSSKDYIVTLIDESVQPSDRRVNILFQVTDQDNRGISGLTNPDFRIAENEKLIGTEAKPSFSPDSIPFKVRTVLLLDMSESVEGLVPQIKSAVTDLIMDIASNQEFAIYQFDSDTALVHDFSSNTTSLLNAVNNLPETGLFNSTNLFGAIQKVASKWTDERTTTNIEAGSIVLFTDGRHNADPSLTISDALNALEDGNPFRRNIYVAALQSPDLDRIVLQQLTDHVAEGYFEASDIAELSVVFQSVQSEIEVFANSLYLLKYQSPITNPDPRQESLEIAVHGNSNLNSTGRINTTFDSAGFGN